MQPFLNQQNHFYRMINYNLGGHHNWLAIALFDKLSGHLPSVTYNNHVSISHYFQDIITFLFYHMFSPSLWIVLLGYDSKQYTLVLSSAFDSIQGCRMLRDQ